MDIIRRLNLIKREKWVVDGHNKLFINWFWNQIEAYLTNRPNSISSNLRWLAHGPRTNVFSYHGYYTTGYYFYTEAHDDKCTVQNSRVTLMAQAMHIFSAKDKKSVYANMSYYGVIKNIWESDYIMFHHTVFQCKWVENNNGIKIDELGFTQVDLNRGGHKEDTFILASQEK